MEIKLFNSLTNKIEVFKSLKEGEVSIYCCGPTVYGDAHVGNTRPVVVFDTLRRFLEHVGYKVKLVSDACATMDLNLNGEIIPAETVQKVSLASLNEVFAEIVPSIQIKEQKV